MKDKIKVLILKCSTPLGGAETLILQHLENLDRKKFEVHFIALSKRGQLEPLMKEHADFSLNLNRKI